jgi:hypothetical protein
MTRRTADWTSIWTAPLEFTRTAIAAGETAMHAQAVIAARTPTLWAAAWNPWTADYRELGLMVSEKVGAARRSARSASASQATMRRAMNGQAAALKQVSGGGFLTPFDWWAVAERNMTIAASLIMLPGEMLKPFHAGVTANAKRLGVARGPI